MAPSVTIAESLARNVRAQTALVSFEDCHVARIGWSSVNGSALRSSGFGLKKCVTICLGSSASSLNSVASGVKSFHAKAG